MPKKRTDSFDIRRAALLIVAVVVLAIAAATYWYAGKDGKLAAEMMGRIGIVLMALWIAWPSLKRPAKWLPASAPVIGVVALIVVAAQPRLILPAIPMVAVLVSLSAIVRAFRKSS
ncbi:MAG: hypothetical protein AAGJ83_09200 [Planctomycetota bacterium]